MAPRSRKPLSELEMSNGKISRDHHFYPVFLLAGFTDNGSKRGKLHCFDSKHDAVRLRTPNAVAFERDYYLLNIPGLPPDVAERMFQRVEDRASSILRRVLTTGRVPGGRDFTDLMLFLASLMVRGPRSRKAFIQQAEAEHEAMLRKEFATPDALTEFVEHNTATDDPAYEADYEKLKSYLDEHGYHMEVADKALAHCKALFQSTQELLPYFAARYWCVKFVAPGAPDFITSDSPIQAFSESADAYLPGARASDSWVGFALPLTHRAVLIGRNVRLRDVTLPFTRSAVNFINGCVVDSADRYIYARGADFEWASAGGEVCDHRRAIAAIRARA